MTRSAKFLRRSRQTTSYEVPVINLTADCNCPTCQAHKLVERQLLKMRLSREAFAAAVRNGARMRPEWFEGQE